eukprot:TRINITY_DN3088_c0_g3_i2.p1 TRINITY_DN3088_c0_g3~~TRINITY_DN3088_c0_g3_i2.p1  ORF type:complete len:179 (-),score=32.28 TRINITY_DN3088_c0_g3_i2:90-626(-)
MDLEDLFLEQENTENSLEKEQAAPEQAIPITIQKATKPTNIQTIHLNPINNVQVLDFKQPFPSKINELELNYIVDYQRLSQENLILKMKIKEALDEKEAILNHIRLLESTTCVEPKREEKYAPRKRSAEICQKRSRRAADQIERHFRCTVQGCTKAYGSENSLNQHIKLKHIGTFAHH